MVKKMLSRMQMDYCSLCYILAVYLLKGAATNIKNARYKAMNNLFDFKALYKLPSVSTNNDIEENKV